MRGSGLRWCCNPRGECRVPGVEGWPLGPSTLGTRHSMPESVKGSLMPKSAPEKAVLASNHNFTLSVGKWAGFGRAVKAE